MKNAIRIDSLSNLIPNKENPEYLCNFKEDGWTFDYFAHITGQKNLIVFFSGIIPVQKMKRIVPYLSKWSWGKYLEFDYDIISANDPSLYLDNKIVGCWGQGFCDDWVFSRVLKHIFYIQQNNNYERIIFNGGSQGGFLSLQAATLMPSIPPHTQRSALIQFVAENPQISLLKYTHKSAMDNLARLCYNEKTIYCVDKKYLYKLDIVELIKKYNYVPNGLIVIKESDTHHYNVHIKYLLDNIPAQQRNNLKIEVIPKSIDNSGHVPFPLNNPNDFIKRLEYLNIMANMYKNYDKYYC